ncbi:MAG: hypothetical protein RIT45_987 [Pseudomonadota bacterium]|jgi:hypothetical protein
MNAAGPIAAAVAATLALLGCASDGAGGADGAGAEIRCELGRLVDGAFVEMPEGGDAELTRGFQGYLLVVAALRIEGATPRKTNVLLRAAKDQDEPHDSARPGLPWTQQGDGAISEAFEVWLSPPLVTAFTGHEGWLEATVREAGEDLCVVRRAVRFVDDEVCMHYEDGSLDCAGAKKGGGAAP